MALPRRFPRQNHTAATAGSVTMTATSSQLQAPPGPLINTPASGTLRLRAEAPPSTQESDAEESQRHVQWAETVINNEGMGKKSSKVCCIYHKPRPVGESSDEDSSDSSSDEDGEDGDDKDGARPSKENKGKAHSHDHCDHDPGGKGMAKVRSPKTAANAYEHLPKTT